MLVWKVTIKDKDNFYCDEDVAIDVAKRKDGKLEVGEWKVKTAEKKAAPKKKAEKVEKDDKK